ncbi:MAG TPA: hypothetical protein VF077_13165 [Nitrospiraceae bacterium]
MIELTTRITVEGLKLKVNREWTSLEGASEPEKNVAHLIFDSMSDAIQNISKDNDGTLVSVSKEIRPE